MDQLVTQARSYLYTLQPGDGTRYTFMLSREYQREIGTTNYRAEKKTVGQVIENKAVSTTYERIIELRGITNTLSTQHFAGFPDNTNHWMITIFEPIQTALVVGTELLARLVTYMQVNEELDYLLSHLNPRPDRYSLAVVLAVASAISPSHRRMPNADELQTGLIRAVQIVNYLKE